MTAILETARTRALPVRENLTKARTALAAFAVTFLAGAAARMPTAFEVAGLSAIAVGIGMIYVPAGVITAGVALSLIGYALDGGDE